MKPTFMSLLRADATREQLEEWCRGQTQSYTITDRDRSGVVARVLGKYLIAMPPCDIALTPHLALNGIWEPWVTMATARYVKPGMRCMDVGACFGYYAVLMADLVGSDGFVQAWEPCWHAVVTVAALLNGLTIDIKPYALGSEEQSMVIVSAGRIDKTSVFNAGAFSVRPATPSEDAIGRNLVQMRAPTTEPFDFIKIDVEGAEADVWQALAGVREVSPSLTVCMEFTPNKHERPPDAFLSLVAADFNIGTVGHDGVPRACSLEEAIVPDTGDFRMLWLTRRQ